MDVLTAVLGGPRLVVVLVVATCFSLLCLFMSRSRAGRARLGAMRPLRRRRASAVVGFVGVACCALGAYAHFVEPRWWRTTRITVTWRGPTMRAVFLSDFHAAAGDEGRVRAIVARTAAQKPDVILLGGDFVEGNDADPRKLASLAPLAELAAPLGVYTVLGNHDSEAKVGDPTRRAAITSRIAELGIRLLDNAHVKLANGVVVTGLGDWRAADTDAASAFAAESPDAPSIVLMHNFQSLGAPWIGRFDLALAGHTHGGQACVPGTELCPALDPDMKPYRYGLHDWRNGGKLFVTAGLGTSGIRARFGVRPEIVVIDLGR